MAKFLFWFQVIMAWFYTVPQIRAILNGKTEGLNLSMYVIFVAYLVFSLLLAIASYREVKEDSRKQVIIIFAQWVVCIGLIIAVGINEISWNNGDSWIISLVLILFAGTVLWYKGIKDVYSKALINVWCKGVPQLWLGCTIFLAKGGEGLPLMTLVAGHLTSIPRLVQVIIAGKSGWDKPTKGLLIGELANVVTWSFVTIIWWYYRK